MSHRTLIDKVFFRTYLEICSIEHFLVKNMRSAVVVRTIRDIGLIARDQRKFLGWTQQDLAERIGSQKKWVVEFEAGKPTLEAGRMMLAINILGLEFNLGEASKAKKNSSRDFDRILGSTSDE